MPKTCIAALLALLPAASLQAQQAPSPELQAATRQAMEAVSFLLGDWAGSGWIMGPDGARHEFLQTERIRPLLGGQVILIEGRGVAAADTTQVVHEAVAFIGYDAAAGRHVMRSFLPGGRTTDARVEAGPGRFVWRIGESVRYTILVDDSGTWQEIGEYTRDGGRNWQQFIEMKLVRQR